MVGDGESGREDGTVVGNTALIASEYSGYLILKGLGQVQP